MAENIENSLNETLESIEGQEIVTMVDVLQEEQELEADANAVLGGSDEKNCTYNKVCKGLNVVSRIITVGILTGLSSPAGVVRLRDLHPGSEDGSDETCRRLLSM